MLVRMSLAITSLLTASVLCAQQVEPTMGPAVQGYGPVYAVPEGVFKLSNDRHYKVSKDVSATADDPQALNRSIESAARFLNMQAQHGTAPEQIDMAVVVHGAAIKDLLTDGAYRKRFGVANPNTGLLSGLSGAGVQIFLCGQTAAARGFSPEELRADVRLALSAMAAHVQLQSDGFTLIPF